VSVRALHPRVALLLHRIRREGGEWTTARVSRTYRRAGYDAPQRHTHRADLSRLHQMGVLDRHEQPGRRYYTPREDAS
jgi:hypothetical protein